MTHEPTKRIRRQREQRRLERQRERHATNAHLRDVVRAIGGGDISDWPQTEQASGGDFSGVYDND